MGRHVPRPRPWPLLLLLLLFLLSLVVKFDASDAYSFREHRKLADSDGKGGENPTKDPQVPNQQNPDPNKKKKGIEGSNNSSSSNNTSSPAPSPAPTLKDNKTPSHGVAEDDGSKGSPKDGDGGKDGKGGGKDSGKNADGKDNGEGGGNDNGKGGGKNNGDRNKEQEPKNDSQSTNTSETCDGNFKPCKDNGRMVGCISKLDPTYVVVLFQNGGNDTIKVKLNEFGLQDKDVGAQQKEKVNISLTTSARTQFTFNAGHGNCVLSMGTDISNVVRLPSYDKILTPVNGAYFLILTVLVLGGTWACCKFRKKRNEEVPYQELEMALPESAATMASNMESAEGWDEVWDDDWDDDVAVKSQGQPYARSISAKGLTSRSSNKDGWEDNWDD